MVEGQPAQLFARVTADVLGGGVMAQTNDSMVEELVQNGSLRSKECIAAFRAIDRRHFWIECNSEYIYADMPCRHGQLHVSAPQIYGEALESLLPLSPGTSFLNVGSGTGYFNSIVSELIGDLSTNHGIDIWPEVLEHATDRCRKLGKQGIQFSHGNVYQLNIDQSMRYDRIYIGACANSRSKYLYRLLEVGGVLVGPFQAGRTQQLRRVVRKAETQFIVEVLESVRFACLVEPSTTLAMSSSSVAATSLPPSAPSSRRSSHASPSSSFGNQDKHVGLPGVDFTFTLRERPWTPERCELYPLSFRRAVAVSTTSRPGNGLTSCYLPREIWEQHIFPWCPRWWFEGRRLSLHLLPSLIRGLSPLSPLSVVDVPAEDSSASSTVAQPPAPENMIVEVKLEEEPTEPDDVIFEVYEDGQRHAIGTEADPDDTEPDMFQSLQVWRLAVDAESARREAAANAGAYMPDVALEESRGQERGRDRERGEGGAGRNRRGRRHRRQQW